jgi:hypothetical protein
MNIFQNLDISTYLKEEEEEEVCLKKALDGAFFAI